MLQPITMWTARKIINELADTDRRQKILTSFWKFGDESARFQAEIELAEALKYRHAKIRKMPIAKKNQLLSTRLGFRDFESHFEAARAIPRARSRRHARRFPG